MKPYLMFYSLWRLASLATIIMLLTITGWAYDYQPQFIPFDGNQLKSFSSNNLFAVKDIVSGNEFKFEDKNGATEFASCMKTWKTKALAHPFSTSTSPSGRFWVVPITANGAPVAVDPASLPPILWSKFDNSNLSIVWSEKNRNFELVTNEGKFLYYSNFKSELEQLQALISFYEIDIMYYLTKALPPGFMNYTYIESPWGPGDKLYLFLSSKAYKEAAAKQAAENLKKMKMWETAFLEGSKNIAARARKEPLSRTESVGNDTAFMVALLDKRLSKEFLARPPFPLNPLDPVARHIKEGGERFLLALKKFEDQTRAAPDRTRAAQDSEIFKARKEFELAFNGYLRAPDANSLGLSLQRMAAAVKLIDQNIATRPSR